MVVAAAGSAVAPAASAQGDQPIVHAVLFYSPSCGHCRFVIQEVLPPLYDKYGRQLQILGFDITQLKGREMFDAALKHFNVEQPAVPFLVVDDITLIGSEEIPEQLPLLIDGYLKMGGAPWPAIPGLHEMLTAAAETATAEPSGTSQAPQPAVTAAPGLSSVEPVPMDWQERFAADAAANTLAVVVLIGMIAALAWSASVFFTARGASTPGWSPAWIVPAICAAGLVVTGYLTYVEATDSGAACGPIGDCNAVQQSPYSHLFGVISIGAFGLIGYSVILAAWLTGRFGRGRLPRYATLVVFGLAVAGTLFSIYLTFLEPFVIGATCAWCLTSALLMTALMVLSAGPAGRALAPAPAQSGTVKKTPGARTRR